LKKNRKIIKKTNSEIVEQYKKLEKKATQIEENRKIIQSTESEIAEQRRILEKIQDERRSLKKVTKSEIEEQRKLLQKIQKEIATGGETLLKLQQLKGSVYEIDQTRKIPKPHKHIKLTFFIAKEELEMEDTCKIFLHN